MSIPAAFAGSELTIVDPRDRQMVQADVCKMPRSESARDSKEAG